MISSTDGEDSTVAQRMNPVINAIYFETIIYSAELLRLGPIALIHKERRTSRPHSCATIFYRRTGPACVSLLAERIFGSVKSEAKKTCIGYSLSYCRLLHRIQSAQANFQLMLDRTRLHARAGCIDESRGAPTHSAIMACCSSTPLAQRINR